MKKTFKKTIYTFSFFFAVGAGAITAEELERLQGLMYISSNFGEDGGYLGLDQGATSTVLRVPEPLRTKLIALHGKAVFVYRDKDLAVKRIEIPVEQTRLTGTYSSRTTFGQIQTSDGKVYQIIAPSRVMRMLENSYENKHIEVRGVLSAYPDGRPLILAEAVVVD